MLNKLQRDQIVNETNVQISKLKNFILCQLSHNKPNGTNISSTGLN